MGNLSKKIVFTPKKSPLKDVHDIKFFLCYFDLYLTIIKRTPMIKCLMQIKEEKSTFTALSCISNLTLFSLILSFTMFCSSTYGNVMQQFIASHIPLREDGKIDIPPYIKHIKLDIGLSYNAPMSQQWLSHESDLWVFGFEPNLNSVNTIKQGAIKRHPSHGDPLNPCYVGESFFVIPCALGLLSGGFVNFYITQGDCGCSSLYQPKYFAVEKVVEVPLFRLSNFFDLFPFDTHPVIEYIKIDAQGSDLDIAKSAGNYLAERVIYITIEAENDQYKNTINSGNDIDHYMKSIGFIRDFSQDTKDPTYFNPRFLDYIKKDKVKIFQRG